VKGDSFVADTVRMWSGQQIGGAVTDSKGAQVAQNHVVFLENFFDEPWRRLPTGK